MREQLAVRHPDKLRARSRDLGARLEIPPNVSRPTGAVTLKAPPMTRSAAWAANSARSRTSTGWIDLRAEPGASTRPPRATRLSTTAACRHISRAEHYARAENGGTILANVLTTASSQPDF